ncbi:MAG: AraC family transcriptional regulator [Sphingomonadaceae bacterium]|nr:AraC family transcriptional regulator [Sphingomonadaceae bacterium]
MFDTMCASATAPGGAPVALDYMAPAAYLARLVSSYYLFRVDLPAVQDVARAEMAQLRFILRGGGAYRFGDGPVVTPGEIALTGPTHAATQISTQGPTLVFGIGLLPAGWAALVDLDAHRARDALTDAVPIFGPILHEMMAQLRTARTLEAMGAIADGFLRRLVERGREPPHDFTDIVDAWLVTDDSPEVDALIEATGLSARQVERLTNRIYGGPPKLLARKFRALRAAAKIAVGEDWSALYEGAFYDQSHAIREFRRFIGLTPVQLSQSRSPIAKMTFEQRSRLEGLPKLTRVS